MCKIVFSVLMSGIVLYSFGMSNTHLGDTFQSLLQKTLLVKKIILAEDAEGVFVNIRPQDEISEVSIKCKNEGEKIIHEDDMTKFVVIENLMDDYDKELIRDSVLIKDNLNFVKTRSEVIAIKIDAKNEIYLADEAHKKNQTKRKCTSRRHQNSIKNKTDILSINTPDRFSFGNNNNDRRDKSKYSLRPYIKKTFKYSDF